MILWNWYLKVFLIFCIFFGFIEIVLVVGFYVLYVGVINILYYDSFIGDIYNLDVGWNKFYYIDLV